jgi:hypothetical protein
MVVVPSGLLGIARALVHALEAEFQLEILLKTMIVFRDK